MRHLLPLSLLLNAALSHAAAFNGRIPARPSSAPAFSINPVSLPLPSPMQLPRVNLPAASGGAALPGRPNPLPMNLPAQLFVPGPALVPASLVAAEASAPLFHMRWEMLDRRDDGDDDGLSPAYVPVTPAPKPLSPAGAMAELEFAAEAPGQMFDAIPTPLVFSR